MSRCQARGSSGWALRTGRRAPEMPTPGRELTRLLPEVPRPAQVCFPCPSWRMGLGLAGPHATCRRAPHPCVTTSHLFTGVHSSEQRFPPGLRAGHPHPLHLPLPWIQPGAEAWAHQVPESRAQSGTRAWAAWPPLPSAFGRHLAVLLPALPDAVGGEPAGPCRSPPPPGRQRTCSPPGDPTRLHVTLGKAARQAPRGRTALS